MANHVFSYLELRQGNDKAKAFFKEWVMAMQRGSEEGDPYIGIEFLYGDRPKDEDEHWGWFTSNVGSKWLTVEDAYDEEISMTTAWDSPDALFEQLVEKLKVLDPNVQLTMTYDDEMPNFVGLWYYNGENDDLDCEHYDSEYYHTLLKSDAGLEEEALCEKYDIDPDDSDAIWDKYSELRDEFWELWHTEQANIIQSVMTKEEDEDLA